MIAQKVGGIGKDTLMPEALKSLARTDDILAVIGIIMLAGVIVGMYGSYWQGKAAKEQYQSDVKNKKK